MPACHQVLSVLAWLQTHQARPGARSAAARAPLGGTHPPTGTAATRSRAPPAPLPARHPAAAAQKDCAESRAPAPDRWLEGGRCPPSPQSATRLAQCRLHALQPQRPPLLHVMQPLWQGLQVGCRHLQGLAAGEHRACTVMEGLRRHEQLLFTKQASERAADSPCTGALAWTAPSPGSSFTGSPAAGTSASLLRFLPPAARPAGCAGGAARALGTAASAGAPAAGPAPAAAGSSLTAACAGLLAAAPALAASLASTSAATSAGTRRWTLLQISSSSWRLQTEGHQGRQDKQSVPTLHAPGATQRSGARACACAWLAHLCR